MVPELCLAAGFVVYVICAIHHCSKSHRYRRLGHVITPYHHCSSWVAISTHMYVNGITTFVLDSDELVLKDHSTMVVVRGLAPETQVGLSRYLVTIKLCNSYCLGISDYQVVQ